MFDVKQFLAGIKYKEETAEERREWKDHRRGTERRFLCVLCGSVFFQCVVDARFSLH
jgi:hypothetical protein